MKKEYCPSLKGSRTWRNASEARRVAPPLGGSNAIAFEIAVRENRARLLVGNLKPHLNAADALWASEAALKNERENGSRNTNLRFWLASTRL